MCKRLHFEIFKMKMLVDLMVKIMKKHIRAEYQSYLCLELHSLNTFVSCVHKISWLVLWYFLFKSWLGTWMINLSLLHYVILNEWLCRLRLLESLIYVRNNFSLLVGYFHILGCIILFWMFDREIYILLSLLISQCIYFYRNFNTIQNYPKMQNIS